MYITLETDYAIRIIDCLARAQGRMGAQAIADATSVTLRFSLKILRKLVGSEILVSFKGASGGYELNRSIDEITLHDILETIEGSYRFSRCLAEDHVCAHQDKTECPYHRFFDELSSEVKEKLDSVSIKDMISKDGIDVADYAL